MRRPPTVGGWLLLCRPGFEAACAGEASARWPGAEPSQVERGVGWVLLGAEPLPLDPAVSFRELVFARQGCWVLEQDAGPAPGGPSGLAARLAGWRAGVPGVGAALVEAPDGDAGRRLWPQCRSVQDRLPPDRRGSDGKLRLHLTLLSADRRVLGVAPAESSSPHAGGIPRLRHSREAPSRSALKLEEALGLFLDGEVGQPLRPGMRAVDLGAAPGGWSWVLARRGVRVTAVDNGPLGRGALDTGLVEPVRADGFTYRPPRPVDWLVCDMVAPPARVAKLVGLWGRQGLCRRAVFNLKLPSGDRLSELRRCEGIVRREVAAGGGRCELRFKHLYHDREELTGYLHLTDPPGAPKAPTRPRGGKGRRGAPGAGGRRRPGRPGRRRG